MGRCAQCKKKLGVLEYKCKCDKIFCITHLHAESHSCTFNYKEEGEALLKKQLNTGKLVDKIERF